MNIAGLSFWNNKKKGSPAMLDSIAKEFNTSVRKIFNNNDKRANIQDGDIILGLAKGFSTNLDIKSQSDLRVAVTDFTGVNVRKSAFNERISTREFHLNCKLAFLILVKINSKHRHFSPAQGIAKILGVDKVVGVDGSIITLWDGLSDKFKGTFNESSVKLNYAIDLLTGAPIECEISQGARHDSKFFVKIEANSLYLVAVAKPPLKKYPNFQNCYQANQQKS
jgi:hypothetical protein